MDSYENNARSLTGPAVDAFDITPNDSADLPEVTRAIYVGTGGDLTVTLKEGGTVTYRGLPAGQSHPIRAVRVLANGTTAADLIGEI